MPHKAFYQSVQIFIAKSDVSMDLKLFEDDF